MRKKIAIAISVAALFSASFVFAQELAVKPGNVREVVSEKKAALVELRNQWKTDRQAALDKFKLEKENIRAAFKEKLTAEKCARIQEKIKNRVTKFEGAKEKHASVYKNLLARIDKFIARFEEFNTANPGKITPEKLQALKDDRATLAKMIDDFKLAYADYFTKLSSAKNFTCGQSEGDFRAALTDARAYLKGVHTSAAEIRTFVRTEILPDLLAIKKEIAQAKGTDGEDKNKTENDSAENEQDEAPAATTNN